MIIDLEKLHMYTKHNEKTYCWRLMQVHDVIAKITGRCEGAFDSHHS